MLEPLFGANIDPVTTSLADTLATAQIAESRGLDLALSQDHPYNRGHVDTWTLLSFIAARTQRIHVGTNVANIPLRTPAMLAKMAATLSILTGGRVELGIGAGAFWHGIRAYGGPERTPGEAYRAFKESLDIIQGMLANAGGSFTYEGEYYQIRGARPGPAPVKPIRIWVGATGPKMLQLSGARADGILTSITYVPPERLHWINEQVDQGAEEAGRAATDVRRGYNLIGAITPDGSSGSLTQEQGIIGPKQYWIDQLVRLYGEMRQDTFLFWPTGDERLRQLEIFANEIVPKVREEIGE